MERMMEVSVGSRQSQWAVFSRHYQEVSCPMTDVNVVIASLPADLVGSTSNYSFFCENPLCDVAISIGMGSLG